MCLWCCWKGLDEQDLLEFMQSDIDLKAISITENSNKFQKTWVWKEKSVEDVVTLGPTAQATLVSVILNQCC